MKHNTFIYSTYFLSMFSTRFDLSNLFRSSPYWVPSAFFTWLGCPFQSCNTSLGSKIGVFLIWLIYLKWLISRSTNYYLLWIKRSMLHVLFQFIPGSYFTCVFVEKFILSLHTIHSFPTSFRRDPWNTRSLVWSVPSLTNVAWSVYATYHRRLADGTGTLEFELRFSWFSCLRFDFCSPLVQFATCFLDAFLVLVSCSWVFQVRVSVNGVWNGELALVKLGKHLPTLMEVTVLATLF